MLADELEIFGDIVHLLAFQIRDDNKYLVASCIVHAAQQHEFWQLQGQREISPC